MRTDQYDKLKELTEELTDIVIKEANHIKAIEPTVARQRKNDKTLIEERRLHWRKKNTMATLGVLQRINWLTGILEREGKHGHGGRKPEGDARKRTDEAIAEATAEVERIRTTRGPALDG